MPSGSVPGTADGAVDEVGAGVQQPAAVIRSGRLGGLAHRLTCAHRKQRNSNTCTDPSPSDHLTNQPGTEVRSIAPR
jgi:hypothetical protein